MWCMWWELRDKLKPYKFDVAVDVQGRPITGLCFVLASGAPIRPWPWWYKEPNWLFYKLQKQSRVRIMLSSDI